MVRPNGQYVENIGVEADIAYTVTESDFMNGYTDYVRAFSKAAVGLVGVTAEDFAKWEEAQKAAPVQPAPAPAATPVAAPAA